MALHTQSTQARRSDESDKDRCAEVNQLQQKAKLKSIYSLLLSLHGFDMVRSAAVESTLAVVESANSRIERLPMKCL